ncbi:MAG: UDP-N-acetylglucosamine--N-acetylmuramyl-(pentapeptide) pyrophosphoryl-undecaprenol N-acetylglucosamine transferase, partial [Bacteroidetes bacterium]|nr:UDP-N-acetylglucosamine--N-acetylmuramyl-(pentapeptide) pyrophosphoryl-undecaprenol N-acetylglucosamine transferase [Bacteroidota bacterium]
SPNVAEDHQTRNARFLSDRNAAILLNDSEAEMKFYSEFQALLSDRQRQKKLSENILRFARPLATTHITDAITELTKVETTIKSQI